MPSPWARSPYVLSKKQCFPEDMVGQNWGLIPTDDVGWWMTEEKEKDKIRKGPRGWQTQPR